MNKKVIVFMCAVIVAVLTACDGDTGNNTGKENLSQFVERGLALEAVAKVVEIMSMTYDQALIVSCLSFSAGQMERVMELADSESEPASCFVAGLLIEYGLVEDSKGKGEAHYYQKASGGYPAASYLVIMSMLQDGVFSAEKIRQADPLHFENGAYKSGDPELNFALNSLRQCAERGFPPAQVALAFFKYKYSSGLGNEVTVEEVCGYGEQTVWLKKAAEQKYVYAEYLLARRDHLLNVKELGLLSRSLQNISANHSSNETDEAAELKVAIENKKGETLTSFNNLRLAIGRQLPVTRSNILFVETQIEKLEGRRKELLKHFKFEHSDVTNLEQQIVGKREEILRLSQIRKLHSFPMNGFGDLYGVADNSVIYKSTDRRSVYINFDIFSVFPSERFMVAGEVPEDAVFSQVLKSAEHYYGLEVDGLPFHAYTRAKVTDNVKRGNVYISGTEEGPPTLLDSYFEEWPSSRLIKTLSTPLAFSAGGRYLLCKEEFGFEDCKDNFQTRHTLIRLHEVSTAKCLAVFATSIKYGEDWFKRAIFTEDGEFVILGNQLWYIKDLIKIPEMKMARGTKSGEGS